MVPTKGPGVVDLHAHTVYSDGLLTPGQVVREARNRGLVAVGITDHDTMDGIGRALTAARRDGIEVVPGVELSCNVSGIDLHMLGYYLDHQDSEVHGFFLRLRASREDRARQMVERLGAMGHGVSFDRVRDIAGKGAIGRPHVAQAMVEAGVVAGTDQAFRQYIGYDGPAYVPKARLSPDEAVSFIRGHGGVAVVAHPGTYRRDEAVYAAIAAGADGVEVWHPDHGEREAAHYAEMAQKNGLLMTGGSDCHGGRKANHIYLGEVQVPYRYLAALKRRHRRRKG